MITLDLDKAVTLDVDNVVETLNEINPFSWRYDCEAKTLMIDNPYKQMNRVLVRRDAVMWYSFHSDDTWEVELERDDNGVIVTEFHCNIDLDKHITYTVLSYYGCNCGFEAYDLDLI